MADNGNKNNPNNASNFEVTIQGLEGLDFATVSPLSIEIEDVPLNSKGDNSLKNQPGRYRVGDIVMTRPYKYDKKLVDWVKLHIQGNHAQCYKNASIRLLDHDRSELGRYELNGVWIKKYSGPSFSSEASATTVQNEELILSVQEAELQ